MMIKVSEATPSQINYLVAKIEGVKFTLAQVYGLWSVVSEYNYRLYEPATDWEQGGPIIERKEIGISRNAPCSKGREWEARPSITAKGAGGRWGYGPTPLIAAMRCYVTSKLGDTVDVPEELINV
jgi:hypothetical protein